jgi:DNA-binding protein H-NS
MKMHDGMAEAVRQCKRLLDQSDGGRTWSDVGRRPSWFVKALASERPTEDMLVVQPGSHFHCLR